MRQKILLFISILVLNCFSLQAEEESLPQLPELPSVNTLEPQNAVNDQLSFFDKIKIFFGFGKGLKDKEQIPTAAPATQDKLPNAIYEGDGNTDEGPMSVSLPTFTNEGEKEENLPSNFDDVSLDQNTNAKDGDAINNANASLSKELPKEGAGNLDDKLELPTGFDDIMDSSTESMEVDSESAVPSVDQLQAVETPLELTESTAGNTDTKAEEKLALPSGFDEAVEAPTEPTESAVENIDTKAEEKLALPSGFDEAVEAPTEPTESAVDNTDTPAEEKLALPSGFDDAEKTSIESTDTTEGDTDTPAEEKLALPSGFDENEKGKSEDDDITDVTIPGPETTVSSESLLESPSQDDDVSKLELPALASAVAENDEFAVPSYVSEIDTKKTSEDDISKYTKELQEKQKTLTPVDKISEAELATGNNVIEQYTEITSASLDKTQLEFVNNEAQVLILPNDDIVLGELTEEAKFNLIDLRSYAQIFWDKYYQMQREPERRVIEDFIKNYDDNFGNEEYLYSANIIATGMKEAFKSIDKDNIYSLIAILNSYPVLQLTGDGDNTLLHEASYVGNYSAARLLVLKGIDIFAKNENNQTALNVAEKFNNQHIVFLLKSANLK